MGKKQGDYYVPFFRIKSIANVSDFPFSAKKLPSDTIIFSLTGYEHGFCTFGILMILKIIIWSIVLTMIVRFVFRFLFPVMTMTKVAQERMMQMQQQMEEMQRRQQAASQSQAAPKKNIDGDYIDYEEVK